MPKPNLLVAAPVYTPQGGSEPGKAFYWTDVLSDFYQVNVLCTQRTAERCRESRFCQNWQFHPVGDLKTKSPSMIHFYQFYLEWCRRVIHKCRELIPKIRPVGLHHPSLGSFRMLPAYHRLPIPYTLGPLGGGECPPFKLLREASLPPSEFAKELLRPVLNYACLLNWQSRRVIQQAQMVLATTSETERLLQLFGARRTAVVFPDALDLSRSPSD